MLHCSEIFNKFKFAGLLSQRLRNSFSLEVVLSQDVVHAFCPDQFHLCVDHKKVATAALVQAGVEEALLTKYDIVYDI
jgi:hypothetical protein